MIKKFIQYIKEGKGISNINKSYSDYFVEYYKQIGYGEFILDDNDDQTLPLNNCLLKIESGKTYALFDPTKSFLKKEDDKYYLYNIIFTIKIENDDIETLKELITHELNHCIEYFNVLRWNYDNRINDKVIEIKPNHLSIKKSYSNIIVEDNNPFSYFKYLIYLSLDNEYNARVSQLYQYLKSFNNKDKTFLISKIEFSKPYEAYTKLENFDSKSFVIDCIKKISLSGIIKITKELNIQLKENNIEKLISYSFIDEKIITETDLYNYYNKWMQMFKNKNKKHLNKLYKIVDEVINDNKLNEDYKSDGISSY